MAWIKFEGLTKYVTTLCFVGNRRTKNFLKIFRLSQSPFLNSEKASMKII